MHRWLRIPLAAAISCGVIASLAASSLAETVMEKVARTGVLTVGAPLGIIPFSYVNDRQELTGLSVNLVELIRSKLEAQVGRPVRVEYAPINDLGDLVPLVKAGTIDVTCGSQFTWDRDQFVDFSIPYYYSGIQLLTKKTSQLNGSPESLVGKRIGVIPNSLGETVMKTIQPRATLVSFNEPQAALAALVSGKVDGIAGDSLLLAGAVLRLDSDEYVQVPELPYTNYGIACMTRENNSRFLNTTNLAIAHLMQGYLVGDEKYTTMIDPWVGPNGLIQIPADRLRDYFTTVLNSHESIRLPQ